MAQADVQNILAGLKLGQQRHEAGVRAQLESQAQENQRKHQESMAQIEKDRLQETHDYNQAALKAASAVHKVQMLQGQQAITEKYLGTGVLPSGAKVVDSGTQDDQGNVANQKVQMPWEGQPTEIPGIIGGTYTPPVSVDTLPSPETYQRQAIERETSALAPQTAAKISVEQARQKAEADRQESIRQLTEEGLNHRATQLQASQQLIAKGHDAARMAAARVAASGKAGQEIDPTYAVDAIRNGQYSDKDIKAQFPYKQQQDQIFRAAEAAGVNPVTEDQKKILGQFKPAASIIPLMDQFVDIMQKSPNKARFDPTSPEFQRAHTLQAQIKEGLVSATPVLGQQSRISKDRIDAINDAYGAKFLFKSPEELQQRALQYHKLLTDTFHDKLSSINEPQRQYLLGQMTGSVGTPMTKEQVSPSTGAKRTVISLDGGKTWQPQPPQAPVQ